ncbi:MAG: M20/M25/M40 family metallo-hydrolase [Candidatus Lokiarchaeota archaeon]
MYNTFNDLVRTSVNLASVETKRSKIRIQILHRSFFQFENHEIYEKINCILNLSNLKFKLKLIGGYKEWKSNPQSKLLKVCSSTYKLLYDKYPNYKMIHGIVECGIFNAKAPNLEIISLGCEVRGAHSPEEMVSIDDISKTWDFLNGVLNSLNKS